MALVKAVNVASGLVVEKRLIVPHATAGKIAGLVAFLAPFAIMLLGITASAIVACPVAMFAVVLLGHLNRGWVPSNWRLGIWPTAGFGRWDPAKLPSASHVASCLRM